MHILYVVLCCVVLYMCVCVFICICIKCLSMWEELREWRVMSTYVCVLYMCVFWRVCVNLIMWACVHVHICLCLYVRIYGVRMSLTECAYIYIWIYTYMFAFYACVCMPVCFKPHLYPRSAPCVHLSVWSSMPEYTDMLPEYGSASQRLSGMASLISPN